MAKRFENGKYRGRGVLMELGLSKKQTEQIAIVFDMLDDGFAGESITYFGSFSDAAVEITLKAMRTAGWKGNDLNDLSLVDAPEVELVLANETYDGVENTKVKWVNQLGGGARLATPLQPDQQKAFAARMRAKIVAFDQGQKHAGSTAPKANGSRTGAIAPEPPPHTDSDLPPV